MTVTSLYSGVSGLKAQSNAIDTIGNNIANVNTVGFRRARLTTSDMFSVTLAGATGATATKGGINPKQIGLGTQTDSIDTIFTQGNTQQTGRLLDLSIQGGGFFQLTDGSRSYFTRAGNFGLDEMGYITMSSTGYRLVGQIANSQGNIDSTLPAQPIKIDFNSLSEAVPTGTAVLGGNLNTQSTPTGATSLNTLVTLFNEDGQPLGLNAGDTITIAGGSYNTVPAGVPTAIPSTTVLTVSPTTTLGELATSLRDQLRSITGSTTLDVSVDSTGGIRIETGPETITNLSVTAYDVNGAEKTQMRAIFNDGELDGDMDLLANSAATTGVFRQADATSSTEVYDSQGNSRTVITTFAKDRRNVPAPSDTLLTSLFDSSERSAGVTAGYNIVIAAGTTVDNTTTVADTAVLTVTATSTLEDLRAALQTALNTIDTDVANVTVSLQPDGSFRINSPSGAITDMRIQLDSDAVGAGAASSAGVITRMFTNKNFGISSATDGLDVALGVAAETNTFHTGNLLLNSWTYQVVVPHNTSQPPSASTGELVFLANGNFDNYGKDASGNVITGSPVIQFDPDGVDPANGGVDSLTIQFDFTDLSQNASATSAAILTQDGSPVGQLESIDVSNDGVVTGVFSNGTTRTLAQVLLASFANDGGLLRQGDNLFVESSNSGEPVLGAAGTLARGDIASGELELSNVDISEEFVNLIVAQRAFQANARVITTGDNILQELVNLVR